MITPPGSTNVSVYWYIVGDDSNAKPGEPVTGLLFSDIETGGSASYARQGAARVDLTLITLASASATHADGGFILVDDTNMPGVYRCDYPDAAFVAGVDQVFCQIVVASGKNAVAAPILVDLSGISADAYANLQLMYDGTGYTDDTAPASRSQVSQIANVGAAINVSTIPAPNGFVLTTGSEVNDEDDTIPLDGTRHELTDAAGVLLAVYKFDIGGDAAPVSVTFTGVYTSGNDLWAIEANTGTDATPVWVQIGTLVGTNSAANVVHTFTMFTDMVVSDIAGQVQIRINGTGLTSSSFDTDQVFVSKSSTSRSVGYANGAVWIDTNNGKVGTESFFNGVADRPALTLADAIIIAGNVGLVRFIVINGSSIVFAEDHDNESWDGENWDLDFGSNSISGALICGANVTGTATGASLPRLERCKTDSAGVTLPPCRINSSTGFDGTLTFGSAGDFFVIGCDSLKAGAAVPTIDLGLSVGASNVAIRKWGGGLTLNNVQAGDVISIEGVGGVITLNGTGGSVFIRGTFDDVVDNSGAAIAIDLTAMLNRRSLNVYPAGVVIDTNSGNTGTVAYSDGTFDVPAGSLANARTIAGNVGSGINEYDVLRGSSITLDAAFAGTTFNSRGALMVLNNKDISNCSFTQMFITGNGVGTSAFFFNESALSGNSLDQFTATECTFAGTVILTSAAEYKFLRECSSSSGSSDPVLNLGAVGNQILHMVGWRGNIVFDNIGNTGTDVVNIYLGSGKITLNASCIGGTLNIFGTGHIVVNNGATVVNKDTNTDSIASTIDKLNDVQARVPAALVGGRMDSNTSAINNNPQSAANLARSTKAIVLGAAVAGTLTNTQMSTDLSETTVNHFRKRQLYWTTGVLANSGLVTVTASSATGLLTYTVTETGESPADGDEFVLV